MGNGQIPLDDNGKPLTSGYDAAGHQAVALQAAGVTTDPTTGIKYGVLNSAVNLNQINGAGLSASNPVTVEQNIATWTRTAQAYSAVGFQQIGAASAGWYALSVFNPATSGKNVLIYSVKGLNNGGAALFYAFKNTNDPALPTVITPVNQKFGGAASVLTTTVTYNTSAPISFPTSTAIDAAGAASSVLVEMLTNGSALLLPSGSAFGVQLVTYVNNSATYGLTMKWVEY